MFAGRSLGLSMFLILAVTNPLGAGRTQAETLTVFAASSLTESFTEIGQAFEKVDPGVTVRFEFAGSQTLAAQIEQGATADVFASADLRWVQDVRDYGKLAGVPRVFAANRVVVIVPKKNPARIESLRDLARPGVKVALATSLAPIGRYSGTVLVKLAHAPGFPPDFRSRVRANATFQEDSSKAVVAKVQRGEVDAGFVYATDVTPAVAPKVQVFEIPERARTEVAHAVGVLKDAPQPEAGQAFVGFLLGLDGQEILKRHGFQPPPDAAATRTPLSPPDSTSR